MRRSFLSVVFILSVLLQAEVLSGQGISHAFILDYAAKKYPKAVIPEDVLIVINGIVYRKDIAALEDAIVDVDLSFDSVKVIYIDKASSSTYHPDSGAIIISIYRHVNTRREVKKSFKKALTLSKGMLLKTAHRPIYERFPVVMVDNVLMDENESYNVLTKLSFSAVANIAVLDSTQAVKLDPTRVNGFVKIRLKK